MQRIRNSARLTKKATNCNKTAMNHLSSVQKKPIWENVALSNQKKGLKSSSWQNKTMENRNKRRLFLNRLGITIIQSQPTTKPKLNLTISREASSYLLRTNLTQTPTVIFPIKGSNSQRTTRWLNRKQCRKSLNPRNPSRWASKTKGNRLYTRSKERKNQGTANLMATFFRRTTTTWKWTRTSLNLETVLGTIRSIRGLASPFPKMSKRITLIQTTPPICTIQTVSLSNTATPALAALLIIPTNAITKATPATETTLPKTLIVPKSATLQTITIQTTPTTKTLIFSHSTAEACLMPTLPTANTAIIPTVKMNSRQTSEMEMSLKEKTSPKAKIQLIHICEICPLNIKGRDIRASPLLIKGTIIILIFNMDRQTKEQTTIRATQAKKKREMRVDNSRIKKGKGKKKLLKTNSKAIIERTITKIAFRLRNNLLKSR